MDERGTDYNHYRFSKKEWLKYGILGIGYFFLIGMIFYQNLILSIFASLGAVIYIKEQQKQCAYKRKEALLSQFREGMYSLASSLSAGRSVEQAFIQSYDDLTIIFNEDQDIVKEWELIVQKLQMNETVESALIDFADRADVEDIYNFVSVFTMARKSGGDLLRIIRETTHMINDKIEIKKEIKVMVTQKKFEQKILSYIIPGMILFFSVSSPQFLEPLFTTIMGRMIMTLALILYIVSDRIGRRIMAIEV